jgi:hypothetical protein
MKCYDSNNTELAVGDSVMCIINGSECEGMIKALLDNNKIAVYGENGLVAVNARNCFWLPS